MCWKLGTGRVGGATCLKEGQKHLWRPHPETELTLLSSPHPITTPTYIQDKAVGQRLPLRNNPERRRKAKGGNRNKDARDLVSLLPIAPTNIKCNPTHGQINKNPPSERSIYLRSYYWYMPTFSKKLKGLSKGKKKQFEEIKEPS